VQLWNYGKYARVVTNVEMQTATISAPWLQVQHLKIPVVIGFLPMDNGNAYDQLPSQFLVPAAGAGT